MLIRVMLYILYIKTIFYLGQMSFNNSLSGRKRSLRDFKVTGLSPILSQVLRIETEQMLPLDSA